MTAKHDVRDAFRRWGYLQAELDSLGRLDPIVHPELEGATGPEAERWRRIYAGSIGAEFMHIADAERSAWVAESMEAEPRSLDRVRILRRLAQVEGFENFIHRRYVGSKRYSLDGSAAMITLLDEILEFSAELGARLCLIGMGHRGRLNVMVHVVGRPARDLFAHYEDNDPRSVLGSGDVRYHLGATGSYQTSSGRELKIHLVSNPSHLEAVDPVMTGRARARQERVGDGGKAAVLPVLVHGDGALAGQGIAAETLNLDGVTGFNVGGTIHVVVNNLIGFTTPSRTLHGSRYATDVARRLPVPILHVNGEDPEAVARVGRIAAEFRDRFGADVVIDLIGYRRHGHSEVDDPTTTQPLLYRRIAERPRLWQSYGKRLGKEDDELDRLEAGIVERLTRAREEGKRETRTPSFRTLPDYWSPYRGGRYERSFEVDTGVAQARLQQIADRITSVPDGFTVHPKVARGLAGRRQMGEGETNVDWGMAEALAIGSLLWDGTRVRLSGEDSRRGTFNQRHAVLIDTETGREHAPLNHLHPDQAPGAFYDTPLSEAAILGFEYGFSRDSPETLVCWEAQFGDFVNGAQIVIDQFIAAGEDKWGLNSGLVLLLPHGFEGQGPEHSSARLERFLQLVAEDNFQVCQPSTAAQYFHLLRRQALRSWRKPLVVLTPKGLLRAADVACPLQQLTTGRFRPVLGDDTVGEAERILVCSGKIAHELRAERQKQNAARVAIVTLEQLYPFPDQELRSVFDRHGGARKVIWIQEEPANMGALYYVRPLLRIMVGGRHVTTLNRSASASPATGSLEAHKLEQRRLIELAFSPR